MSRLWQRFGFVSIHLIAKKLKHDCAFKVGVTENHFCH